MISQATLKVFVKYCKHPTLTAKQQINIYIFQTSIFLSTSDKEEIVCQIKT